MTMERIIAIIIVACIAFGIFVSYCAADIDIDMSIIARIESSFNTRNISYKGAKVGRGLFQISEACLLDYNRITKSEIAPAQLFNSKINYKISRWYITKRIPQLLRHYGVKHKDDKEYIKHILMAYNWGPRNVYRWYNGLEDMPAETEKYLFKYHKLFNSVDPRVKAQIKRDYKKAMGQRQLKESV